MPEVATKILRRDFPRSPLERPLHGLDPFDTLPLHLNRKSESLIELAQRLWTAAEFASLYWGQSFISSYGLSLWFSSQMKLCNLLEGMSAYLDAAKAENISDDTIYWRSAGMCCLRGLICDPTTRYNDEVLAGIIALMHRYQNYPPADARTSDRPHSAGLRNLITHRRGWENLNLPCHLEQYVMMSLITSSCVLASYLDNLEDDPAGQNILREWHAEVGQVVVHFGEVASWALEKGEFTPEERAMAPLKCLRHLLAQASECYDQSHKLFILVCMALTRYHVRTQAGRWQECLDSLEQGFQKMKYRTVKDFSWAVVQSSLGGESRKWETVHALKVLYRIKPSTRGQVYQWLFDIVCGTGTGGALTRHREEIQVDALDGLPNLDGDN